MANQTIFLLLPQLPWFVASPSSHFAILSAESSILLFSLFRSSAWILELSVFFPFVVELSSVTELDPPCKLFRVFQVDQLQKSFHSVDRASNFLTSFHIFPFLAWSCNSLHFVWSALLIMHVSLEVLCSGMSS